MTNARPLNRHATGQLLALIKRPIETFDQDLSVYRLAQETYCSGLDGACANGLVLKCAEKNNRCGPALSHKGPSAARRRSCRVIARRQSSKTPRSCEAIA